MPRDIDQIIEQLRLEISGIEITQLQVTHPGADDDGIWLVKVPGRTGQVQLESSFGACPFVIESDFSDDKHEGRTTEQVVSIVTKLLAEPAPAGNPR